jgi:hypothetical protein
VVNSEISAVSLAGIASVMISSSTIVMMSVSVSLTVVVVELTTITSVVVFEVEAVVDGVAVVPAAGVVVPVVAD